MDMEPTAAHKKGLTKAAALTLAIGVGIATAVALFVLIADGALSRAVVVFVVISAITAGLTVAAHLMRRGTH